MDWREEACDRLLTYLKARENLEGIENKTVASGIEFLSDYFLTFRPKAFLEGVSEDSEEASADLFATEVIGDFEKYLRGNKKGIIEVLSRHNWRLTQGGVPDELDVREREALGDEGFSKPEEALLKKNITELNSEDSPLLETLFEKSVGNDDDKPLIAELALKRAHLSEQMKPNSLETAEKWVTCGEKEEYAGNQQAHKRYKKAAHLFAVNIKHADAGKYYEKAHDCRAKLPQENNAVGYIRLARLQYDIAGYEIRASELYIKENDLKLDNSRICQNISLRIFKVTSIYGESPRRVLSFALGVIIVCAVLYFLLGIYTSGGYLNERPLKDRVLKDKIEHIVVKYDTVDFSELFNVSLYYSVVTFTTLGYGDFSPANGVVRVISAIQAVLGLLLTSLFTVSVVRKYFR